MSSDFSKDKLKLLASLNQSGSSELDESVYAPTRKLPKIPIQLSELYEDFSDVTQEDLPAQVLPLKKEEDLAKSPNTYRQSFEINPEYDPFAHHFANETPPNAIVKEAEIEPQPILPSFEVKLDPNSMTAKFEKDALLREQLENVDFYIEQGFLDVAFSTLERLEVVFPSHPLISERLEKMATVEIKNTSQGIEVPFLAREMAKNFIEEPVKSLQTNDISESMFRVPNTGELQGLEEHYKQDSENEMDFKSLVTNNPQNTFDKEDEALSQESNLSEIPSALYETITDDEQVVDIVNVNQVDDAAAEIAAVQNGLRSLIDEGEGEEGTFAEDTDEEFSSHFNVGQAYFDIELFDDAIEEFQAAYRTIQYLGPSPKMFQCCILLGRCFRLKEMPRPALIWLKKALDTKQYRENERLELFYEFAGVYEELGEQKKALEFYQEIAKVSLDYQDISLRISKLT
jgi:tetratricopeptide (TPR) repeat protein